MADDALKIRSFSVNDVAFGKHYSFENGNLVIPETFQADLPAGYDSIQLRIVRPHHLDVPTNSIMDIVPISTKVLGKIGTGLTHTLTGVYMLITGATTDGVQLHDFGSSDGVLKDQLKLGKAGTPGPDDFIIMFDVLLQPDFKYDREFVTQLFDYSDQFIQPIRKILKMTNGRYATETHTFYNERHPGKPKVTVVKEVAGQGTMYDNLLFPQEPSGMTAGASIIDLNNFPVLLTANEYRDGAIRAMV